MQRILHSLHSNSRLEIRLTVSLSLDSSTRLRPIFFFFILLLFICFGFCFSLNIIVLCVLHSLSGRVEKEDNKEKKESPSELSFLWRVNATNSKRCNDHTIDMHREIERRHKNSSNSGKSIQCIDDRHTGRRHTLCVSAMTSTDETTHSRLHSLWWFHDNIT